MFQRQCFGKAGTVTGWVHFSDRQYIPRWPAGWLIKTAPGVMGQKSLSSVLWKQAPSLSPSLADSLDRQEVSSRNIWLCSAAKTHRERGGGKKVSFPGTKPLPSPWVWVTLPGVSSLSSKEAVLLQTKVPTLVCQHICHLTPHTGFR